MMNVQWQVIDLDTKKAISVGERFELVEFCKEYFDGATEMSFQEAFILFGDPGATSSQL